MQTIAVPGQQNQKRFFFVILNVNNYSYSVVRESYVSQLLCNVSQSLFLNLYLVSKVLSMDGWRGQRGRGSRGGRGGGRGWRGGRRRERRRGDGTGSGGDGTPRNQAELKLGFRELQALKTKTSDEIIHHLTSSRWFQATEYLFKQQSAMEDHWIVLIVRIVTKACDCSYKEDLLQKLLILLPGSSFLNLPLRRYLNKLSANSLPPSDVVVFLRNVVKMMNELLRRFPSCYADLPLSDLYCGTMRLSNTGQLEDDALVTEVDEIIKLRMKKAEELKKKEEEELQKRRKPGEIRHIGRILFDFISYLPIL